MLPMAVHIDNLFMVKHHHYLLQHSVMQNDASFKFNLWGVLISSHMYFSYFVQSVLYILVLWTKHFSLYYLHLRTLSPYHLLSITHVFLLLRTKCVIYLSPLDESLFSILFAPRHTITTMILCQVINFFSCWVCNHLHPCTWFNTSCHFIWISDMSS
jgi:hypothetical protein